MVQALTHGNEICGAIALDFLFRTGLRPDAGRLILAFANVEAFRRFDFDDPDASRCVDEDYNRVWADEVLFGPRDSVELRRARQLQPFVDQADFLLDIHSMHDPCRPIGVCGMIDKHLELARRIGMPADLLIDTGHPAGLRMRDRGGFNDPASPRHALLVECGQHWERSAAEVAVDTTLRFLAATASSGSTTCRRTSRCRFRHGSGSCGSPNRWSCSRWTSSSWSRSSGSAWSRTQGHRSRATATAPGRRRTTTRCS